SPFDLRWIDDDRLLLTATEGETTTVHLVDAAKDAVRSTPLPPRYLAPPEIVPAGLAPVR
ncbi:MAG: hypothetical protein ACREID_06175, partial [Planctomycetota bacterium]